MDLRLALRSFRRRPVVSGAVVTAVAMAVAITTALFSVMDGLLFRPLPFADPDQLVAIDFPLVGGEPPALAYMPDLADRRKELRERVLTSALVAGAAQAYTAIFFEPDAAKELGLRVQGVNAQFFPLLGLSPARGTNFTSADERLSTTVSNASGDPVPVIIGDALWRLRFGADPNILGVHSLAGRSVRIVGVMPPGTKFPGETNVWAANGGVMRDWPPTYIRLARGASVSQLAGLFPDLRFRTLREILHPGESGALPMLFGAAVLLLIVTWVQVAALMLSGAIEQLRDIGVRLALGAGRARLLRQFAVQSALLAAVSAVLAWMILSPLTVAIIEMLPSELSRGKYLTPDFRAFAFSCALSVIGFGVVTVVPFVLASRATPLDLLHRRVGDRHLRAERVRQGLLIVQMTVTALLLYVSGLAAHSFAQARTFDYGFDADHVVVFTPPRSPGRNRTSEQEKAAYYARQAKIQQTVEFLPTVPDVVAVANMFSAPLEIGNQPPLQVFSAVDGLPTYGAREVRTNSVGPAFLTALGARLVTGRDFNDAAFAGRRDVALVNETLARRLSPQAMALGELLPPSVLGRRLKTSDGPAEIVGVIRDFVDAKLDVPAMPQIFYPSRDSSAAAVVLIRVSGATEDALPKIRAALETKWGVLRPAQLALMRDGLAPVLAPYRGQSILLSLILACCLPVAAIGLYGALAQSVRARTREIAIRMALGADAIDVRRAISRRALLTVATGALLGMALGVVAARLIANQLFQVSSLDAVTVAAVACGLTGIGWLAAFLPARQASQVSPAEALREN